MVLADGREAFVKTRADASAGEYAAEAAGLHWLAEPGALRTPRVLDIGERYLALEWIAPGRLDDAGAEELGRGLAATHAAGAERFGAIGGSGGSRLRRSSPRGSARWGCPTSPPTTGPRSTPSGACARSPRSRATRRALPALGGRRGGARVRAHARAVPVRPSRPRGCTGICGRAT